MGHSGRCLCGPGDSVVLGAQLFDNSRAGQYQTLTASTHTAAAHLARRRAGWPQGSPLPRQQHAYHRSDPLQDSAHAESKRAQAN